jgi:hypothetical protein
METPPTARVIVGSYRNGYYCPFCREHIDTPIGIYSTPVIDCPSCAGVGVLVRDPNKEERCGHAVVKDVSVALRPVKHVRVDSDTEYGDSQAGREATFDPPVYNITPAARLQGINVAGPGVFWITTTDDAEHGFTYAWY